MEGVFAVGADGMVPVFRMSRWIGNIAVRKWAKHLTMAALISSYIEPESNIVIPTEVVLAEQTLV